MLSGNILSCIRNITLRTIKKPEGTNVPIVNNDKCRVLEVSNKTEHLLLQLANDIKARAQVRALLVAQGVTL